MIKDHVLRVNDLMMSFVGNVVLKNVNFTLRKGEILALLGENGAGKSTLMKILNGIYRQKGGEFYLNGTERCRFNSTKEAQEKGIVLVHQELNLVPNRTVAENIVLGNEPLKSGFGSLFSIINRREMRDLAKKYLEMIAADDISVDTPLHQLTAAQQQLVEIAKALKSNPDILLLDEPTSSLSDEQAHKLIDVLHVLKERMGIIFTTHRIQEALDVTNNFLILRDGEQIAHICDEEEKVEYKDIIEMMVGRAIENIYPKEIVPLGEEIIRINSLSNKKSTVKNISIHKGEIFGFGGLMGAGRSEALRMLFGADKASSYDVFYQGERINITKPYQAVKLGIGYVPEERQLLSIIPERNVIENMVLSNFVRTRDSFFTNNKKLTPKVLSYIESLEIRLRSPEQEIKYLSGGNQQKVVLAKWLMINPKVLILDEPTRGIDVGAKAEVYKLIGQLVKEGMAIILISSDLSELVSLSDRVAVMSEGQVIKVLDRNELTSENVMYYAGIHRQIEDV